MEKWQFCIGAVKSAFGDLVSAMYIRQFSKDQLDQYKRKVTLFIDADMLVVINFLLFFIHHTQGPKYVCSA